MDPILAEDSAEVLERLGAMNERFAGKSVLITGAAGFLGAQFVHYFATLNARELLSSPVRVVATDNFMRGRPSWIGELNRSDGVEILEWDVTQGFPSTRRYDFIIHGASIASPTYYRLHPIETIDANVRGLRSLLDLAGSTDAEGMLFFSSSEVYGDPTPDAIPTPESYPGRVSFTGPRACYDESKRFGETLCVNFAERRGVPVVSVRPFNNYGPGLKITDRRVLPDFFRDVLRGKDIVLLSDGSPTRTFCYTVDALDGYMRALLLGRAGEAYNIGNDKPEISMADLAELVVKTTGARVRVLRRQADDSAYLTDNPQRRCPDITKARTELGFRPAVSLEEGLMRQYRWYLAHPDAEES